MTWWIGLEILFQSLGACQPSDFATVTSELTISLITWSVAATVAALKGGRIGELPDVLSGEQVII
jgi:hypothetical protein